MTDCQKSHALWAAWMDAMRRVTGASGRDTLYLSVLFHLALVGES